MGVESVSGGLGIGMMLGWRTGWLNASDDGRARSSEPRPSGSEFTEHAKSGRISSRTHRVLRHPPPHTGSRRNTLAHTFNRAPGCQSIDLSLVREIGRAHV